MEEVPCINSVMQQQPKEDLISEHGGILPNFGKDWWGLFSIFEQLVQLDGGEISSPWVNPFVKVGPNLKCLSNILEL